jgi:hypothetical protein
MNVRSELSTELTQLARRLAIEQGSRRAAGLLFNLAALILAENGITDDEMSLRLRAAFMRIDIDELVAAAKADEHDTGERH